MAEQGNWAFPKSVQPRQDELRFDLDSALDARSFCLPGGFFSRRKKSGDGGAVWKNLYLK